LEAGALAWRLLERFAEKFKKLFGIIVKVYAVVCGQEASGRALNGDIHLAAVFEYGQLQQHNICFLFSRVKPIQVIIGARHFDGVNVTHDMFADNFGLLVAGMGIVQFSANVLLL
jgi:hypothetical protein